MVELANLVIELTNSNSKIEFLALPQDDPRQRKPDISLAKEVLNWEPTVELENGLLKTIEYLQTQIK
jgi:UDP-glucuronate decarboxylase